MVGNTGAIAGHAIPFANDLVLFLMRPNPRNSFGSDDSLPGQTFLQVIVPFYSVAGYACCRKASQKAPLQDLPFMDMLASACQNVISSTPCVNQAAQMYMSGSDDKRQVQDRLRPSTDFNGV